MKKLLSASIATATLATMGIAAPASAELSANAGLVSEYVFRGVGLGDAGVYVGADYDVSGFYIGTWIIDDGNAGNDGLETDFYLGYGMEHGDFSWSVGANLYEYTYTSDYESELILDLGFKGFSLSLASGTDTDDFEDAGGFGAGYLDGDDDLEVAYTVVTVGYSSDVFGVTLGSYTADGGDLEDAFGGDFDDPSYNWAEVSASGEVASLDASLIVGTTFGADGDGLGYGDVGGNSSGDGYIVIDISKSFSF